MNKKDNAFSFADLVRQYKIEIPIIQRDYAQGRDNTKAVSIRKQFVADLLNALKADKKDQLELSFVYGRVENGVFIPVDGQQRLTTLYLLHMYLVKRCKMERCNSCIYEDLLSRFTYATRQSAREFCEKISEPQIAIIPGADSPSLIDYIHDQPWFFVEWRKDPTIEGMLRVLEEIHLQTESFPPCCCGAILAKLFDDNAPVRFRFMDMEGYSQTDDLYLKMNARGLPLTALENLKCSIESYCDSEEKREKLSPEAVKFENPGNIPDWEKMSFGKKLSRLFDGAWLDAFWSLDEENIPAKCDATIMVFVARMFALYAMEKDPFPQNNRDTSEDAYYLSLVDEDILGVNGREDYLPFDWFKSVLEHNRNGHVAPAEMLNRFANWMNIFCCLDKKKSASGLTPSWEERITWKDFLEKFKKGKAWRQYAALYAILSFFDHWGKWDESEFKEWMRVQWNIIENSSIDSFEQMERYVKFCSSLVDSLRNTECQSVLKYLAERQGESSAFKEQVEEEVIKAKLICRDGEEKANRNAILKAERLPWFRGRISAIIADNGIIDNYLKSWFSEEKVGEVNSQNRQAWVKKVICCIEQEYNAATDKPRVYFPVRSIIIGDASLKEAIYNKTQRGWIAKARNVQLGPSASVWIKRMAGDDKEEKEPWKNRICISSYRGGGVYAYRVAYITGAYRLDETIDWWHDFVQKNNAHVDSWQTNDCGTWIQCEIQSGDYKGVYALCQIGEASFIQKKENQEWYPSNEEATKMWNERNKIKRASKFCWESLLSKLNKPDS
jgi:hypothetical protein